MTFRFSLSSSVFGGGTEAFTFDDSSLEPLDKLGDGVFLLLLLVLLILEEEEVAEVGGVSSTGILSSTTGGSVVFSTSAMTSTLTADSAGAGRGCLKVSEEDEGSSSISSHESTGGLFCVELRAFPLSADDWVVVVAVVGVRLLSLGSCG